MAAGCPSCADVLAWAVVLLFVFPIFWWVLASFKPYTAIFSHEPVYVGFKPTVSNYGVTLLGKSRVEAQMEQGGGVGGITGGSSSYYSIPSITDSIVVACGSTALVLVLGTLRRLRPVALRLRGRQAFVFWVLSQRMMPPIAVAIPLFFMFRDMGLRDTYTGLILPTR